MLEACFVAKSCFQASSVDMLGHFLLSPDFNLCLVLLSGTWIVYLFKSVGGFLAASLSLQVDFPDMVLDPVLFLFWCC